MNAAVVGSGFAGLSAAEKALENYGQVVLYSSSEKKISEPENGYGEFLGSLSETPISKSYEGVLRKVEELEWLSNEMTKNLKVNDSYVIDRSIVQANWIERLKRDGLQTNLEEEIDAQEFDKICESFDLVIDASGPEPISEEFLNISVNEQYSLESISTRQVMDFDDHPVTAVGSFMKKFYWINTRSEDQATVGAVSNSLPELDEAKKSLKQKLGQHGVAIDKEKLTHGKIPFLGYRDFKDSVQDYRDAEIRLVGDAAGLTNGITGFGLQRACESGEAAAELDSNEEYFEWLESSYRTAKLYDHTVGKIARVLGWNTFAIYMEITGANITYPASTDPRTPREALNSFKDITTP
jgi:flavin-dependent dehydrogenase